MATEEQGGSAALRVLGVSLGVLVVGGVVLYSRKAGAVPMPSRSPLDPVLVGTWGVEPIELGDGEVVLYIDGIEVRRAVVRGRKVLTWEGDLSIDADGAPRAYHPDDWGSLEGREPKGIDAPENAGAYKRPDGSTYALYTEVRNWWAVATKDGVPLIQGPDDPAPGYFVSTTALSDSRYPSGNQRRYVDAETVPYVAIPRELVALGARVGDVCHVSKGARACVAVVGDIGPQRKLGEGSIALARELGLSISSRMGRVLRDYPLIGEFGDRKAGIRFTIFTGTNAGWPRSPAQLVTAMR